MEEEISVDELLRINVDELYPGQILNFSDLIKKQSLVLSEKNGKYTTIGERISKGKSIINEVEYKIVQQRLIYSNGATFKDPFSRGYQERKKILDEKFGRG